MKNLLLFLSLFAPVVFFSSCEELPALPTGLTEAEVREGLKEALQVSTDTSVSQANKTDGFNGKQAVRILLPNELDPVYNFASQIGIADALLEELEVKLNRAAEDAAVKATPIFLDAITNITIADAFSILTGADTAATFYLKSNTKTDLQAAFKPDIQTSLETVGAQQIWEQVTTEYNTFANSPLNILLNLTDLASYTTGRALDGLFHYVGKQEEKSRKDPLHRVTSILERVFGDQ